MSAHVEGFEQSLNETEVLRQVFQSSDKNRTGHVRASSLIKTIRENMSALAARQHLERLGRMLDANQDDAFVTLDAFLATGAKWITHVRAGAEGDTPTQTPTRALQSHSNSTLGLLGNTVLYESILFSTGDHGPVEQNPALHDTTELSFELSEMRRRVMQLSEEKTSLQRRCSNKDDANHQLETDNLSLKKVLKATQMSLDLATRSQANYEDLKTTCQLTEEKYSSLKECIEKTQEEMKLLLEENQRLRMDLSGVQEALEVARKNGNEASANAESFAQDVGLLTCEKREQGNLICSLQENLAELKKEMRITKERADNLEETIKHLTSDLEGKDEILKEVLSQKGDPGMEISFDNVDIWDDNLWSNLNSTFTKAEPKAASTPFHKVIRPPRCSIGDEMKDLGVIGSPLLDKASSFAPVTQMKDCAIQTEEAHHNKYNYTPNVKALLATFRCVMVGLLLFTFFGGIEIDDSTFYPITWLPGLGLPEPLEAFRYQTVRKPLVW